MLRPHSVQSFIIKLGIGLTTLAAVAAAKPWKGAEVISKQTFRYGAFEARIRAAKGSGVITPFFLWKDGSEIPGAQWQEQDFEIFGRDGSFQSQLMTPGDPRVEHVQMHYPSTSATDRYNTYRMEWTPDSVNFYFNGQLIRKETNKIEYAKLLDPARAEPAQLRISNWAGDFAWSSAFDSTAVPADVFVNWIQTYSYTPGTGPQGSNFTPLWRDDFNSWDNNRWWTANWTFEFAVNDYIPENAKVVGGALNIALTHWTKQGTFRPVPPDDGLTPPVVPTPVIDTFPLVVPGRVPGQSLARALESKPGNEGDQVCTSRDLNVDFELSNDTVGGLCHVAYTDPGEWVEYDLKVLTSGSWEIGLNLASAQPSIQVRVTLDGNPIAAALDVPSNGWQAFSTVRIPPVAMPVGTHILRVAFPTGLANLHYIEVLPAQGLPPSVVTNLSATAGDAQVSLAWTTAANAASYKIFRSTDGTRFDSIATTLSTQFTDANLTNGQTYNYRLVAANGVQQSAPSITVIATPRGAAPAIVTGLVATPGVGQIQLSWAPSATATGYTIFRSVDGGAAQVVTVTSNPSHLDQAVGIGSTYGYSIVASNIWGDAANSAVVTAMLQAIPAAPSGLTAQVGRSNVTLSWTVGANNLTFNIYRSFSGGGSDRIGTSSGRFFTDPAVSQGSTYTYTVTGVNGSLESAPSNSLVVSIPGIAPVPVTGLVATAGNAAVSLSWPVSAGATTYKILRSFGSGAAVQIGTSTTATYTDATVVNGTTYVYSVVASNSWGDAAVAATASATPTAPPTSMVGLKAQYKNGSVGTTSNGIRPLLQVVNTGTTSVALSQVTVRYWFTKDGATAQSYWCDWAKVGQANVVGAFKTVAPARPNADGYLELSFKTAAGSLAPGAGTGEIQSRFSKSDWSNYTQTNDASYDATKANAYADWNKVTVYVNGTLVWGVEP